MSGDVPERIGPYHIVESIAAGGMGVVYEATHADTGARVAVKTVRLPDATMLAGIRREVYALQRLDHPGVVRIIDQGVDPLTGPWYAMELLEGTSLRARIDAWSARGPSASLDKARLVEVATIFYAICEALAYVHAHGVVHRDLKPENVQLTDDGRVVIFDFGLSSQFGSLEDLSYARSTGGTLRYLAPELLESGEADARADLYALGAMLHESIAGAPPFDGGSRNALIAQLRVCAPTPLGALVADTPEALSQLVLLLLRKHPEERIGHATDVARALVALGARVVDASRAPVVSPYLYRASLVGRASALEGIARATWLSPRGHGCVFVLGEGGVGKSRVLVDAAARLQRERVRVVEGAAEGRAALGLFRSLLERVADECREDPDRFEDDLLLPYGRVLALYEPSFEALVPPEASRAKGEITPRELTACLLETLRLYAAEGPVALLLDDLQRADELSLALLAALASDETRPAGVTVVGACRSDEIPDALARAIRVSEVRTIELQRLGVSDVSSLLQGLLAMRDVPIELADFVFARSEGNPFFASEYVRSAITEGLIQRDVAGRWFLTEVARDASTLQGSVPKPTSVAEAFARRLLGLSPATVEALHAAAVLGRDFLSELVLEVAEQSEAVAWESLDELRRRQIVEPRRDGGLRFAHDLFRETALQGVHPDRTRDLHRRAAEATERHPAARVDVEGLGHHWSLAGVDDKAARYLTLAGDMARDVYANQRALDRYDTARSHLAALAARGTDAWRRARCGLEERRGIVLTRMGAHDAARSAYDAALTLTHEGDHLWRARLHRLLAKTREADHQHALARAAYDAAMAELGKRSRDEASELWWREWVETQVERVWVHYWLDETDAMSALVESARESVAARGTASQRARLHQAVFHSDLRRLRYRIGDDTIGEARAAMAASVESGDTGAIAYARFIVAFGLLFAGQRAESVTEMRAALEQAQRAGDAVLALRCRTYLTTALRLVGEHRAARAEAEVSLQAAVTRAMLDYQGVARANIAWAALRQGDLDTARRESARALETWRELSVRYQYPMRWMALLPAMACALAADDTAEAVRLCVELIDARQMRLDDELTARCSEASRRWESGDAQGADATLRSALRAAEASGHL